MNLLKMEKIAVGKDPIIIEFPGTRPHFDKSLLTKLADEINGQLKGVRIQWFKCKPPLIIPLLPTDITESSLENANMLVISKENKKILESFKYRSGLGVVIIYPASLSQNEFQIVSNVLHNLGFVTPLASKESRRLGYRALASFVITAFLISLIILSTIILSTKYKSDFIYQHFRFIGAMLFLILIIGSGIGFFYLIKARKILRMNRF